MAARGLGVKTWFDGEVREGRKISWGKTVVTGLEGRVDIRWEVRNVVREVEMSLIESPEEDGSSMAISTAMR